MHKWRLACWRCLPSSGPEGLANFYYIVIGCVIAFALSFLIQYIWGLEDEVPTVETETESALTAGETLTAPLSGTVIKLADVADEVFASGMMRSGAAIIPSEGKVYAPADATVTVLLDTKHAIGLRTDSSAELLIHVGMDTVELGGKHFETHVAKDQHVTKGTLLLSFDAEEIKAAGYDTYADRCDERNPNTLNLFRKTTERLLQEQRFSH